MDGFVINARAVYQGDINEAVIKVQKAAGVTVDKAWWDTNVGNQGTPDEILLRFDTAYRKYVASLEQKEAEQAPTPTAQPIPSGQQPTPTGLPTSQAPQPSTQPPTASNQFEPISTNTGASPQPQPNVTTPEQPKDGSETTL